MLNGQKLYIKKGTAANKSTPVILGRKLSFRSTPVWFCSNSTYWSGRTIFSCRTDRQLALHAQQTLTSNPWVNTFWHVDAGLVRFKQYVLERLALPNSLQ
jgi:hypothetical protein